MKIYLQLIIITIRKEVEEERKIRNQATIFQPFQSLKYPVSRLSVSICVISAGHTNRIFLPHIILQSFQVHHKTQEQRTMDQKLSA